MKLNAISPDTIAAAGSVAGSLFGGGGGASGRGASGAGGASTMPPVTISPAFQQSFTPQFSPAMQQQQDSPGATQTANPTQRVTGGQSAGGPTPGGGSIPGFPQPSFRDFSAPVSTPTFQNKSNYQSLITTGIIAITVILLAKMYKTSGKGKGKSITPKVKLLGASGK